MSKRNRKKGMPNLEAIEKGIREEARRAAAEREAQELPFLSEADAEYLIAQMDANDEVLVEPFTHIEVPRAHWKIFLMRQRKVSPKRRLDIYRASLAQTRLEGTGVRVTRIARATPHE